MNGFLKVTFSIFFTCCCLFSASAQKKESKGITAKINGSHWTSTSNYGVVWDSINKVLTVSGVSPDGEEKLTIQLVAQGLLYQKGFSVGEYYFFIKSSYLDNYTAKASFTKTGNGSSTEWTNNEDEESTIGKVQITAISTTSIQGIFYFNLDKRNKYSYDKMNPVSVTEGKFDIDFSTETSKNEQSRKNQSRDFKFPIGIYDIQAAPGVNWMKPKKGLNLEGDFGTNYSLGFTAVNLEYGKTGASSTVSLHYDYSRQNAEDGFLGSWHFRRNEMFARLKPFTSNPTYSSNYNRVWALVIAGLYVDVGYTNGKYFYKDYLDVQQAPDYSQNGIFWGWGYNLVHRVEESRWGMSLGYGSKIYGWTKANGEKAKYSSRTIWIGVCYNIVWNEDESGR